MAPQPPGPYADEIFQGLWESSLEPADLFSRGAELKMAAATLTGIAGDGTISTGFLANFAQGVFADAMMAAWLNLFKTVEQFAAQVLIAGTKLIRDAGVLATMQTQMLSTYAWAETIIGLLEANRPILEFNGVDVDQEIRTVVEEAKSQVAAASKTAQAALAADPLPNWATEAATALAPQGNNAAVSAPPTTPGLEAAAVSGLGGAGGNTPQASPPAQPAATQNAGNNAPQAVPPAEPAVAHTPGQSGGTGNTRPQVVPAAAVHGGGGVQGGVTGGSPSTGAPSTGGVSATPPTAATPPGAGSGSTPTTTPTSPTTPATTPTPSPAPSPAAGNASPATPGTGTPTTGAAGQPGSPITPATPPALNPANAVSSQTAGGAVTAGLVGPVAGSAVAAAPIAGAPLSAVGPIAASAVAAPTAAVPPPAPPLPPPSPLSAPAVGGVAPPSHAVGPVAGAAAGAAGATPVAATAAGSPAAPTPAAPTGHVNASVPSATTPSPLAAAPNSSTTTSTNPGGGGVPPVVPAVVNAHPGGADHPGGPLSVMPMQDHLAAVRVVVEAAGGASEVQWAAGMHVTAGAQRVIMTSDRGRGWLPASARLPVEVILPWDHPDSVRWEGIRDPARVIVEYVAAVGGSLGALASTNPSQPAVTAGLPFVVVDATERPHPEMLTEVAPGSIVADRVSLQVPRHFRDAAELLIDPVAQRQTVWGMAWQTAADIDDRCDAHTRILGLLEDNRGRFDQARWFTSLPWEPLIEEYHDLCARERAARADVRDVEVGKLDTHGGHCRGLLRQALAIETVLALRNPAPYSALREALYPWWMANHVAQFESAPQQPAPVLIVG